MRQGQQNRRGRGRGHNNNGGGQGRKGQNPLTRSFESNGPDVKIRGTPAHVAEKYMSLARDALSSGDPVLAENYLQHAEHYNRIIMAYREQQMSQGGDYQGGGQNGIGRFRPPPGADQGGGEAFGDEDIDEFGADLQPSAGMRGPEPQPSGFDQAPRHDERPQRQGSDQHRHQHQRPQHTHRDQHRDRHGGEHRGYQGDRGESRQERYERFDRQDRQDRHDRGDRHEPSGGRQDRPQQGDSGGDMRRRDRVAPAHEQPEFLRRSVRRPRREEGEGDEGPSQNMPATEDTGSE